MDQLINGIPIGQLCNFSSKPEHFKELRGPWCQPGCWEAWQDQGRPRCEPKCVCCRETRPSPHYVLGNHFQGVSCENKTHERCPTKSAALFNHEPIPETINIQDTDTAKQKLSDWNKHQGEKRTWGNYWKSPYRQNRQNTPTEKQGKTWISHLQAKCRWPAKVFQNVPPAKTGDLFPPSKMTTVLGGWSWWGCEEASAGQRHRQSQQRGWQTCLTSVQTCAQELVS